MSGIFISYRRDDSEGQAGRLFEGLKARYGQDRVFIDVAGIEPGRDFRRIIDDHVGSCDVLLALIGKNWLHAADKDGRRRLDSPEDFVRLEIAAALRRDITVIPVLVQGAAMPSKEELPPDLQALAWRNAAELRHTRWDADFAELATTLQSHSGYVGPSEAHPPRRPSRWRWPVLAVLSLAVLMVAIAVVLRRDNIEVPKLSDARNSPSSGAAAGVVEAAPIPAIRLDGRWEGTVTYDWGPSFDETFTLRLVGGTVTGSAGFLGQGRTILEGFLEGSSLRFVTKRIVTAGSDQREVVNRYAGTVEGDKIDMVLSIEDAASSHEPVSFTLSRFVD
jgi:hypothetical protein